MLNIFGRGKKAKKLDVKTPIQKINEAALALVEEANQGQRGSRLITRGATLEIVRRSLVKSGNESFSVQKFRALKDVSEHIALAQRNKVVTASAAHFDLLPIGHPSAKRDHVLSSLDVMRARARWFADDPIVLDENVGSLLATAFTSRIDSPEYLYSAARLLAMGATRVPIAALVAVALGYNDGANRGFWREQIRSPKTGRWVKMFGLGSIKLLDKAGQAFKQYFNIVSTDSRNGTVVGETPDGRLFRVGLEALDGGDAVKALLPSESTPDGKSKNPVSVSSSDTVVDEANLQFVDNPDGFTKGSSSPTPRGLDSNKIANTWDDELGNYQVVKGDFRGDGSDFVVSRLEQDSVTPIGVAKNWADTQKLIEADEPNFRDGKDAEPNLPEGMDLSPAPRGAADVAPAETPAGGEPKWKDRFGRTMPLGRPINFKVKNERGSEMDVYGEFVGDADKEGFGLVRVERNPQVPDGIYEVSSDNGGELLPSYKPEFLESVGIQQGKNDKGEDVAARTPEQIPSINEIVRRDFDPVDDSQRPEYEGWEATDFADEINEYVESQRQTILEGERRAQGGDGFDDPPAGTPEERTEKAIAELRSRVENLYSKEHWTYTKGDNQLIIHKRLALRDPEYAKEVAEAANLLIENEPVPGGVTTYVSPGLKAKINALGVVNTFAAGDASPGKSGIFGRPTSINMYHRDSLNFRGLDNPLDVMGERLYVPFAYERMGENGRKRPTATLAHEWGHARDYNFGDEGGMEYSLKMKRLIEENPEYLDGVGWYGRTNTYEVVAEYYSQYIGEKYYGAEPMGIPQPIIDLFDSKLAVRDGDIDTQLKNALKNYKLKPNDRYTADGQRKNGAEDIFADKANPKKAQGKLEPTPEPETPQGPPDEPPTPEAPATPEPEGEYTPDELAAGWGFNKNADGSYTGDGDDGAVDVSQLPNGKWLVERRLGEGEVEEFGPFDSPEEAFDAAQIEAGRKGQFDEGAVEEFRDGREGPEFPEGMYRVDRGPYTPQGPQDGVESEDYTDDPVELAQRFDSEELEGALEEAVRNGEGEALLPFEAGDEYVPAEALYNALKEQDRNPDLLLDEIYNDVEPTPDAAEPDAEPDAEADVEQEPITPEEVAELRAENEEELPALLDGLSDEELADIVNSNDYRQYLPENDEFDVPEGMYEIDSDPMDPMEDLAPDGAPDGAPNNAFDMAMDMSAEDLEAGLRGAVAEDEDSDRLGYYPIQAFDEDGEPFTYDVPAEAWRDALQLQGIDTNEILREAYSADEMEPDEVEEALVEEGEEPIAEGQDVPEELLDEPFDPSKTLNPDNVDKVPVGGAFQIPLVRLGSTEGYLKLQRTSDDQWLETIDIDGSSRVRGHDDVRSRLGMYGERGDDGMRPIEIDGTSYSFRRPEYLGVEDAPEVEAPEEAPTPEAPEEETPRKEMKSQYVYQGGAAFLRGGVGAPFRDPEIQEYIRSKGFNFVEEWNGKRVYSEIADLSLPEFKEVLRELRDRFGVDLAPRFEGSDIDIDAPDEEVEAPAAPEAPETPEAEAVPSPPITSRFGGEISNDWVDDNANAFDVNEAPVVGDIQVGDFIPAADGGWHEVINLEPDPDDPDGTIVTKMRLSNGEIFRGRKTTKRSPGLGWANGKEISGLRRRKDFDGLSRDEIEGRAAQTPDEMMSNAPAPEAPAPSAGVGGRPTRSGAFKIPRPVRPAFLGRVQEIVNGLDEKNGPNLWEALKGERLVAFDFETVGTGNFDYDNPDEPVALAAYVYENGELVDQISLFMNPDRGLGEWYYVDGNVGGDMKPERMLDADGNPITDEWLATQPGIEEQIKKFLDFAGPNAIFVAQNAEFDTSMLEFWARKNGIDFTANDVIDTLPIADSLFGKGNASLGKIADQLGIEVDPNMLHNAGTDASILHEALGKMLAMMDGNNREFDLERANAAYEAGLAQYKFNVAQKQGQNADSKVDPVDADDLDDTPLAITSVFGDEISNDWVEDDANTSLIERMPTGDVRVGDFVAAKGGGWHEIIAIDPDPVSEDAVILTKRRLATGEVKRGRDTASSAGILGWFKNTPLTVRRRLTDADLPSTEEAPVVDLVDKVDAPEVPTTKEEAAAVVGNAIDSAIDNNNNVSDNVDANAIEAAQEGSPAEVIVDASRQGFSDVHLDANGTPLREGDRVRHVKSGRIGTVRTPMEVFKSGNYMYNNYLKVHFDDAPKREPIGANRLELISEGTDSPNDYADAPTPAEIPETPPVTPETSTEPPAEVADETGLTDAEKAERLAAFQALDPMSDVNDELETSNTYEVNITPARARALVYSIDEKYSGASWGDESNGGTPKENEALNRLEELIMPLQSKGGKIQITPREMWVIQNEILSDLTYYKEATEDGYITSEERGSYKALLNLNNELAKIRKDLGLVGTPTEAFNKEREIQRKYDNLVDQRETRAAELQLEQDYAADLRDEETPTVEDLDRDPEEYEEEQYPPTKEQRRIISAIMTGKSVIVRALAGTGKTSTLKLAAKRLLREQPDKKIVYVAFNKTVQEEANSKMPSNVEARTADSIAFRWAPKEMTAKYTNQRNNSIETARTRDEIAEALGIPKELRTVSWQAQTRQDGTVLPAGSFDTVDQIRSIIDAWTISDKDRPEIPRDILSALSAHSKENPETKSGWFRDLVDGYVEDLQSPIGVLPINNGHITKFWALSKPDLSASGSGLTRKADIVFFDEAQDINPVLAKVIADQKMQKVYVGDGNQAIYGFRGAVDQLDKTEAPFDLPMTQSFRFGPQIAGLANRFLEGLGSPYRLRGNGPDGEITYVENPDAILARTNAGVVKEALNELNKGNNVAVTLSTKDELKALVRTVRWFKEGGNKPRSLHPDLAEFKDWGAAQDAANTGDNPKVRSLVTLVEDTFEGDVDELDDFVDGLLVESQISKNVGDAPTSAADGESGELGADIDWRVDGTRLIFFGKGTFQSKDLIKSVQHEGWGPRWNGDDKYWFFNVEDDDTRLEVLNKVRNAVVGTSGGDENVTVITTAHKSKGLEWDTVRLSDDFFTPRENPDGTMQMPSPEEMRLDYVALTRGRKAIDPGSLEWIYDYTSGESENPDRGDFMQQGLEMAAPSAGSFDSTEVGDNIADTATKLDKASEEVADLIISLLEKGVAPWQKPWTGGAFLPTNYATGRSYNGLNIWTLLGTMELKGYSDNRWMTFAQAKKLGGFVRKGEKSTPVIYMSPIIKKKIDEKTGEETEYKIWTSRIYRVFNVAQIDGIDIEPQQEKPPVPVTEAETILLDAYKDKPQVFNTPQDQAYYSPFEDVIRIPLREQFDTPAGYFETLAHELAHSTAHKDRLDRTALTDNYGSHKASRGLEELIAEISVALVAGRLNADYQIESVAAYADSWLNALQRDKSMILKATRAAQAATDYMLGDYGKNQGKNRIPDSEEPTDDQAEPNVGESGKTGEQIAEETQGEAPRTSEDRNVGESGETGEEIAREDQTGVFNEYDPSRRVTSDSNAAETTPLPEVGFDPEEDITVYRGVPAGVENINPGDWVTTSEQLARDYAGDGDVISLTVKAKELRTDPSVGEDAYTEEMVYVPSEDVITSAPDNEFVRYSGFGLDYFYRDLEVDEFNPYTPLVADAVDQYQNSAEFLSVNKGLRNDDPDVVNSPIVEKLDEAVRRGATLTQDTTLWRAIRMDIDQEGAQAFEELQRGDIIEHKGYVSTTANLDWAVDFTRKYNASTILQIQVPAGTRGMVPYLSTNNLLNEYEFVLPRGTRFQVVSRNPATGIITVRIV